MSVRVTRLLKRNGIEKPEVQLLYLYHVGQKTVLHTADGIEVSTSIPLKEIITTMPEDEFWLIQKGIAVSSRYVVKVDTQGMYTMLDGRQFKGRRRNVTQHKRRWESWEGNLQTIKERFPLSLKDKCALMDDAPIAFCIIELVFAEDGHGVDFIFRYCNKEMEVVEGVPVSEMVDRSFYEVFPNGDRKWIIPYADVALNGARRVLRDFSPEINKKLIIRCFQPQPGYCACFLVVDESSDEAE